MSRIGRQPVAIPKGVQVTAQNGSVKVKGPKGELAMSLEPGVSLAVNESECVVKLERDDRNASAVYGLTRAMLANLVRGVGEGFSKSLEIQGTGYRAALDGKKLVLQLGYSHPVEYPVPDGVNIKVDTPTKLTVSGADKQQVGQVAAHIRGFRPPEPYKGKGVRYEGEYIKRKAGKSAGA
ncbi:MAG TPA: 50S ribosomal protein L6 [Candidatus Eisenbacteria bacterium]|jgi:large subunit ribosomal protein L6|nr:50S ribosomal protein L6 [Candidatus Eisenbacteria bacterium]